MIRRSTWIVVAAFLTTVGFAVWWTRYRPEPAAEATQPAPDPAWTLDPAEIEGLRVEDLQSGLGVEVRREGDEGWRRIAPSPGPVDALRVERAVSWISLPLPDSTVALPEDLSGFGLNPPRYRVTVYSGVDQPRVLLVGRDVPTGSWTYAMVQGGEEILVFSQFGLAEVLGLIPELHPPTSTAAPAVTASPAPAEEATPAGEGES